MKLIYIRDETYERLQRIREQHDHATHCGIIDYALQKLERRGPVDQSVLRNQSFRKDEED